LRSYNGTVLAKPADESGWKDAPDPVGPTDRLIFFDCFSKTGTSRAPWPS